MVSRLNWILPAVLALPQLALAAAPSTPEGLIGVPLSATEVEISWTASTDDVGVTSYRVLRGGALVGTPVTTLFVDTGLPGGAAYSYTVEAVDGDTNVSATSAAEVVTTLTASTPTWFDPAWQYRIPLTVGSSGFERVDRPVEHVVDLTAALTSLGAAGAVDLDSLRVLRANALGQVVDLDVPFQFDPVAGFDPATHAVGLLTLLSEGTMDSSGSRRYDVYFDLQGEGFTPAVVVPQVVVTTGVVDEGQVSLEIETPSATYYYQEQGAGFSSVVDPDGNDWVSYAPSGGSSGDFRGIPNLTFPGGDFHPGATTGVTTLVNEGPLRAEIESETTDGLWRVRWIVFPGSARLTVELADDDYWFLYEGTPGGSLDTAVDFLIRSDGTPMSLTSKHQDDLPADEWVYFGDPTVDRALFIAHHSDDLHADLYRTLDGVMSIFGFGRFKTNTLLGEVPNTFSIGLFDRTDYPEVYRLVESAIKPLSISQGAAEERGAATVPNAAPIWMVVAMIAAGFAALREGRHLA